MNNPYAPPQSESYYQGPADGKSVRSVGFVILIGLIVPGLPSLLMGRTMSGLALLLAVPFAFALFGPIWGLYLFAGTAYKEHGFYPFILVAMATPIVSVVHGIWVRRQILRSPSDDPLAP